ncbi:MAG: hypothetical protein K6B46_03050 [Opitutales bacterium]|nr:hypothetical protein [Opitutales bacterium]
MKKRLLLSVCVATVAVCALCAFAVPAKTVAPGSASVDPVSAGIVNPEISRRAKEARRALASRVHGTIKVVPRGMGADYRVRLVRFRDEADAVYRLEKHSSTSHFPADAWMFVTNTIADFKIEIVNAGEDFSVMLID